MDTTQPNISSQIPTYNNPPTKTKSPKKFLLFIFLLLFIGLTLFIFTYLRDDGGEISNVRITNLTSNSATITWTTKKPVSGKVFLSKDNSFLPVFGNIGKEVFYDDRDTKQDQNGDFVLTSQSSRVTHHVTIRKLDPDSKYYIRIGSTIKTIDFEKNNFETYAVIDDINTPDPMYGVVTPGEGDILLTEGLIFYTIEDTAATDLKITNLYSTYLNENSSYSANIAGLLYPDGKIHTNKVTDELYIEVLTNSGGVNDYFKLDEYQPLPELNVNKAYTSEIFDLSYVNNVVEPIIESSLVVDVNAAGKAGDGSSCDSGSDCDSNFCNTCFNGLKRCAGKTKTGNEVCGTSNNNPTNTPKISPIGQGGGTKPTTTPRPTVTINPGNVKKNDCEAKPCNAGFTCDPGSNKYDGNRKCTDPNKPKSTTPLVGKDKVTDPSKGINEKGSKKRGAQCEGNKECESMICKFCGSCQNPKKKCMEAGDTCEDMCGSNTSNPVIPVRAGTTNEKNNDKPIFKNNRSNNSELIASYLGLSEEIIDQYIKPLGIECTINGYKYKQNQIVQGGSGTCYQVSESCEYKEISLANKSCKNAIVAQSPSNFNFGGDNNNLGIDLYKGCLFDPSTILIQTSGTGVRTAPTSQTFCTGNTEYHPGVDLAPIISNNQSIPFEKSYFKKGNTYGDCVIEESNEVLGVTPIRLYDPNYDVTVRIGHIADAKCDDVNKKVTGRFGQGVEAGRSTGEHGDFTIYKGNKLEATRNELKLNVCAGTQPEGTISPAEYCEAVQNGDSAITLNKDLVTTAQAQINTQSGTFEVSEKLQNIMSRPSKYIIKGNSNSEIKFYGDTNLNGVKDAEETYLTKTSSYTLELKKTADAFEYEFNNGWNLVHFPFVSDDIKDADTLLKTIRTFGVTTVHITRFENGKFDFYSLRDNGEIFGSNFQILPGVGYFIKTTSSGKISLSGNAITNAIPVDLNNGWNLIGVSNPEKSYTAKSFIEKCEGDSIGCDSLARYDSGLYDILVKDNNTLFGNDFNLNSKSGYFVRVESGGGKSVTP